MLRRKVQLGTVIAGKFRLERVIGRGAMGVVLEATDLTLRRPIAIKLILAQHAASAELRARFVREAQAMTLLHTEHVARVFEAGELEDGTLFLAMEYLEGESLDRLIARGGPFVVTDAVDLLLQALEAVSEAHDLGLVHRDLKPANFFLALRKGRAPIVKVLDFGIVKDTFDGAKLTATGMLPGTPAYMAPEQIAVREELIDARADVWALGITLFELLVGSVPWGGEMNTMLARICTEAPPRVRAARPDVTLELEAIVEQCLAKRPADRFSSAAALRDALDDLRRRGLLEAVPGEERQDVSTRMNVGRRRASSRSPRGRVLRAVTLGVAVCTLIVSLVLALSPRSAPREREAPTSADAALPPLH